MGKFKVYNGNKLWHAHGDADGSPTHFTVGGNIQDKVELRFDEDEQRFYARIINPSQHTQYLYEQGRLAITLCKLNTGVSQRNHMAECKVEGQRKDQFVKRHYHPRWSRCGNAVFEVTDLDEEIMISVAAYTTEGDFRWLLPNQKWSLRDNPHYHYTYIKALLLSAPSDYYFQDFTQSSRLRGYKTYSNRIPVYVDEEDNEIRNRYVRQHHSSHSNIYSTFSVEDLGQSNYRITLNTPSSYWLANARVTLSVVSTGNEYLTHGSQSRKRALFRDYDGNPHLFTAYSQSMNGQTSIVINIDDIIENEGLSVPVNVAKMFRLMDKHDDIADITCPLYIQVTAENGNKKMAHSRGRSYYDLNKTYTYPFQ